MQKILLASTLFVSSLFSDHSLGEQISTASIQKPMAQAPLRTRINPNQQTPINQNTQLDTRTSPTHIKKSFKKDHHRYDKRYSNFDYDRDAYYNEDGYYYGYYDQTGYFYNNSYFTYNNAYTYRDRYYRRGHFGLGFQHRRRYLHHNFNNWNQMHGYYEPNVIVFGHYYDHHNHYPRSYYGSRHSYGGHNTYNNYRSPARMNVTRMNGHNSNRDYNSHNHSRMNVTRMNSNSSRSYSNHSNYRRGSARMRTRSSSARHMGMSR